MPKNKFLNRKEAKRRDLVRARARLEFIKKQVGSFTSQDQLDMMLMGQEDTAKRLVLFNFLKPFIKFPNPRFPTSLESAGGIVAVKPKLVVPESKVAENDPRLIRV